MGSTEIGRELAKKGTTSDVTLYNVSREGHAATLVEPTQFPEKFAPLLTALAMADQALLVVETLDRDLAESAAAADLFDAPVTIVRGAGVGDEEIAKLFRGMRFAGVPPIPKDLPRLRGLVDGWVAPFQEGPVRVSLDHGFPVKGVGAVALGVVRRGKLETHSKLRLYPTDRVVEIRSVQVHDVDVPEATTGERVGVALKGVDADELERGQQLALEGSLSVASQLRGEPLRRCRYYRGDLREGAALHLLMGLAFVPVRLGAVRAESLEIETDRPVAFTPGEPAFLADLAALPGPRIAGRVEVSAPQPSRPGSS